MCALQVSGKLTTLPADQYQTARPDEAPDEDREGSGDMQEGEENRGEGTCTHTLAHTHRSAHV